MIVFLIVCVVCECLTCSVQGKSKVKLVEDYVISANFDENMELPQLNGRHPAQSRIMNMPPKTPEMSTEDPEEAILEDDLPPEVGIVNVALDLSDERELAAGAPIASSLIALGLISFLILLSSLQSSLNLMAQPTAGAGGGGLLGSLGLGNLGSLGGLGGLGGLGTGTTGTSPAGRRKRRNL